MTHTGTADPTTIDQRIVGPRSGLSLLAIGGRVNGVRPTEATSGPGVAA